MERTELTLLKDTVQILIEKAKESKKLSGQDSIEMGQHLAYYDVLSLIRQQAIAFNIDLSALGLEDYDPDIEVL